MSDLAEQLAIRLAGARLSPEPSRACPQEFYGDPANFVKLQAEATCGECVYSRERADANKFCGRLQEYGKKCLFFKRSKK